MDVGKLINIVVYILSRLGETAKTKLMKIMFFADFEHTRKYNKPITWSIYSRLPQGPVPSYLLDIINNTDYADPKDVERFKKNVKIKRKKIGKNIATFLEAKEEPSMEEISDSEKEIINLIIKKYGKMISSQLIKETHKHAAWQQKTDDRRLKYSDTFKDEDNKEYFKVWEEEFEYICNHG